MGRNELKATKMNRRSFTKQLLLGSVGPMIVPGAILGLNGATAPSNRIAMGAIGLGARGTAVMRAFARRSDVRMVALCDVDRFHYRDNPYGKGPAMGLDPAREWVDNYYESRGGGQSQAYHDYRDLCDRTDLDAVLVATPDHWHALVCQRALRAGLDVYCEKPVTHTFLEGQQLYREVAVRKRIFQTGSQQRSDWRFRQAVELVRNGHLGRIKRVEVGLPAGYPGPRGEAALTTIPKTLDYRFWCGPAPMLPYMRARHHRWWRGHSAYGGGNIMDWIGHHNDIAHWGLGLDESGPTRVEAHGWTYQASRIYDMPVEFEIRMDYPDDVKGVLSSQVREGTKWIGESGWVFVNRGILEASDARWTEREFSPGKTHVLVSDDHLANFVTGVRDHRTCVAPAETGHRSITPGHLGFLSQSLGRAIQWDPRREEVVGDDEANAQLRSQVARAPWGQLG